ncbi:MAG: hypothetical protein COT43_04410 [Candidatus Marinimicrobia bacterium CG08_land_8_20_14_0_20_45_22]|nr:MAG: hypothetical protein COT43_04410 [Candidatus Marinimicrobia bacterium CG08_land_8_20_14_0_20_45_22]
MKPMTLFLWLFVFISTIQAQERPKPRGFIDVNHDGINDWFRDANGDGINDLNNQSYHHSFQFLDENKDGINNLFTDEDGDGVNDIDARYIDTDKDGRCENVVDFNHDWINDITGLVYNRRELGGQRYGFILEESGKRLENFSDKDKNGQDDRLGNAGEMIQGRMDRFIDSDGDGVCDQRGFNRHHKQGGRQRGKE